MSSELRVRIKFLLKPAFRRAGNLFSSLSPAPITWSWGVKSDNHRGCVFVTEIHGNLWKLPTEFERLRLGSK